MCKLGKINCSCVALKLRRIAIDCGAGNCLMLLPVWHCMH